MDRAHDIPFVYENGVLKPDGPVNLPEGTRGIAHLSELTPSDTPKLPDRSEFFKNKSLEELAAEQGITAGVRLTDLRGDWPPEDSIDEFLAELRRWRR